MKKMFISVSDSYNDTTACKIGQITLYTIRDCLLVYRFFHHLPEQEVSKELL